MYEICYINKVDLLHQADDDQLCFPCVKLQVGLGHPKLLIPVRQDSTFWEEMFDQIGIYS